MFPESVVLEGAVLLVGAWLGRSISQSASFLEALPQEEHRLVETAPEQMAAVCDTQDW